MSNLPCIYKITNPAGSIYIGQSRNVIRRKYLYACAACKSQRKLYHSILKYGWDSHEFEILLTFPIDCTQEELDNNEIILISEIDKSKSLNLLSGGHKGKHSPESLAKIIAWKIGKPLSEEHKRNISKGNKGKTVSEESMQKMRKYHRGKVLSDFHKQRISEGGKGRIVSDESKAKMKEAAKKRWENMSEEKKLQHKKSLTGRVFSEQHRINLSNSRNKSKAVKS